MFEDRCCTLIVVLVTSLVVGRAMAAPPPTASVGGCLIITVRPGSEVTSSVNSLCSQTPVWRAPNGSTMQQLFSWASPFLAGAFDQAERAHCDGGIGCVVRGQAVHIIVYPNGFPNAVISISTESLSIGVSTGMIDFVDASVRSFLKDIDVRIPGASEDGYARWLHRMDLAAGLPCPPQITPPASGNVTTEEFKNRQYTAQMVYYMIFAHELAHIKAGSTCGTSGDDALATEMACDRLAIRKLSDRGWFYPALISTWMIAMDYYEALASPVLKRLRPASIGSYRDIFPARDWQQRTAAILAEWGRLCSGPQSGSGTLCAAGWNRVLNFCQALNNGSRPGACTAASR
jgi:hypothetical protein